MRSVTLENWAIKIQRLGGIEGPLQLPEELWQTLFAAPLDVCPDFAGPPNYKWKDARGKDHPRYGRFLYAFGKHFRPEVVVEVGTDNGGTAVGWARALGENGGGKLICVDSDAYNRGVYPATVRMNLTKVKNSKDGVQLEVGDSKEVLPRLKANWEKKVDILLVDGDHTYEGARADLENSLPMVRPGGLILVHDIDTGRRMNEQTKEHPHPVFEAFMEFVKNNNFDWCILKMVRKHLGVIRVQKKGAHAVA